jgi:hypothetical protein
MKTKILAGIVTAAVALTGVMGGFALTQGGTKDGFAAEFGEHTLTLNASTCEAYSDSTTPISFAYYGWTIYLRHAGFNSETQRIEIKSFSDELTPAITNTGVIQFPTCSLSGAYYSGITFTDLVRGDGRVFVLEKFTSGLSQEIDVASDGDCNVALDSSVTLIVLESYSTVTSFLNMTVRYFC